MPKPQGERASLTIPSAYLEVLGNRLKLKETLKIIRVLKIPYMILD